MRCKPNSFVFHGALESSRPTFNQFPVITKVKGLYRRPDMNPSNIYTISKFRPLIYYSNVSSLQSEYGWWETTNQFFSALNLLAWAQYSGVAEVTRSGAMHRTLRTSSGVKMEYPCWCLYTLPPEAWDFSICNWHFCVQNSRSSEFHSFSSTGSLRPYMNVFDLICSRFSYGLNKINKLLNN